MTFDPSRDETFPFPAFRDDPSDYAKAALFWKAAFEDVAGLQRIAAWTPWMTDPFRDGHPIFSRIDPTCRRGVLLQQVPPSDDPVWFKCWMARAEDVDGVIPYLFVETHVSRPGRTLFQRLIASWCVRYADEAEMHGLTDAVRAHPDAVSNQLGDD